MTITGMLRKSGARILLPGLIIAAGLFALSLFFSGHAGPEYKPEYSENPPEAQSAAEFVFGIYPVHNPERMFAIYGPIIAYVNARIPDISIRMELSRNYDEFEKKIRSRAFSFALANSYHSLFAPKRGYNVFGKMADDANYYGVILVRRDGRIHDVASLKGKKVSYPAPTALASSMMTQYFLHTHGLDVNRDIENVYVGSQESSILNVYHGLVAAASTWYLPWMKFQEQHPDMAGELVVKWKTDTLPANGLMARDDVPAAIVEKVASVLFSMNGNEEGRKLLDAIPLSRFEPATVEAYAPMREFARRFSAEIRQVDE